MNDANQDEDREIEEPQELVDPPQENNPHKRKPAWVQEAIKCQNNQPIVFTHLDINSFIFDLFA